MGERETVRSTRRRLLTVVGGGLAAASAGCMSGFENDDDDDTDRTRVPEPTPSPDDDVTAETRIDFGASHTIAGTTLTVTIGSPSLKNQVGRTSAPRGKTFAVVAISITNDGDERDTVPPDDFAVVLDEEPIPPDTRPQGSMISGIVEPGTTLEKSLYFPVPSDASSSDVAVYYDEGTVAWTP
jgi:hypothetical protein